MTIWKICVNFQRFFTFEMFCDKSPFSRTMLFHELNNTKNLFNPWILNFGQSPKKISEYLQIVFFFGPRSFDKIRLKMIFPSCAALHIGAARKLFRNLVPADRLRNYFIDHVTHKPARACSSWNTEQQATVYCYIRLARCKYWTQQGATNLQKNDYAKRANINGYPLRWTSQKMIF